MSETGPRAFAPAQRPVIAGLGITDVGKVYRRSAAQFAADAVTLACEDAGMALKDIDGMLVSSGVTEGVQLELQRDLGLRDLNLLSVMQSYGSTAAQMVQYAGLAVASGLCDAVACVFADDPLKPGSRASSAYSGGASTGWAGLQTAAGARGTAPMYAIAARRHMEAYGTTREHFGQIAVAQRAWAAHNPRAQFRNPMTLADHASARVVADPFRLYDCCLVSNGGAAVIVTRADKAAHLAKPPVHLLGWGQSHPGATMRRNDYFGLVTGAVRSGERAFGMAGLTVDDVDAVQLYDCFTYTALVSLEDYGFCSKGEGGQFVAEQVHGPGSFALNTGGGQLSSYYLWGMTPLTEGVIQARGEGGRRQVDGCDVVLVSGNGGILDHHATLLLGSGATA